jgi:hypothetical protein
LQQNLTHTHTHTHTLAQLSLSLGAHFFHNWIKPAKDNNFFISASRRLMRRPECSLLRNAEKYTRRRRCVVYMCMKKKSARDIFMKYRAEIPPCTLGRFMGAESCSLGSGRTEKERVGQKARNIYGARR